MKKTNKQFSLKETIIIIILVSFFMFFLGGLAIYRHLGGINYTLLGNDKNLKKFISTYENLINNYYGEIDKGIIMNGAINGMYASLEDPYTTYLDSDNTNAINNALNGQYIGIGIRIEDSEHGPKIIEVFSNSPAAKEGLKVGDIIIKLNGSDVSELNCIDISELIKASQKAIELEIIRGSEVRNFIVSSDTLFVPSVNREILSHNDKQIGYISLVIFNDTADIQFKDVLLEIEKINIDALILDLRDNYGGYVEIAQNIAEMFLKKGEVIYYLESKNEIVTFTDITNESRDYKIIVLVNNKTASAAEILAASLKYSYGAKLVGNKTYGKGKVQRKSDLLDGSSIKYTTAKWLMSNGECIDGLGILPDFEITLNKEELVDNNLYSDSQILYILNNLVD